MINNTDFDAAIKQLINLAEKLLKEKQTQTKYFDGVLIAHTDLPKIRANYNIIIEYLKNNLRGTTASTGSIDNTKKALKKIEDYIERMNSILRPTQRSAESSKEQIHRVFSGLAEQFYGQVKEIGKNSEYVKDSIKNIWKEKARRIKEKS